MRSIYAFNGDADGLCALQQLLLAEQFAGAELVTGPKRRIDLLKQVHAGAGDRVTVLDLSFRSNADAVIRLLAAGARVRYFDHHHAGELPAHPGLEAYVDTSAQICTSAIVDRYLAGAQRAWAVVGAFGDNLPGTAASLAAGAGLSRDELPALERLGVALNYNAYGETEDDLFFPPKELHLRLAAYRDPRDFVASDEAFRVLCGGYDSDLRRAAALLPAHASPHAALYALPQARWARRVSGVLANRLAREAPARAHAVLTPNSRGGFVVNVRAPMERPRGAAALCLAFATGGGREAAAGINHLEASEVERFTRQFFDHFELHS